MFCPFSIPAGLMTAPDTFDVIFSVVVVLIKDTDLAGRPFLQNVLCINATLALVIGYPAHRPRKMFRIVPLCRTSRNEQLRHLLLVHILLNRRVGRRAERIE